jgi:2'-5' RNA ligase
MSAKKDRIRLFVSIEVPDSIKEKIAALAKELPADSIKPVPVENMHLTLSFLGRINTKRLVEIEANLRAIEFSPFELNFKGVGIFPSIDYVKVVWAGTKSEELNSLAGKIADALTGIVKKEEREFSAHLTIARVRKKIDVVEFLQKHKDDEFGSFTASKFNLMQSELFYGGSPKYTVVSVFEAKK